ncbi:SpoIIE family protein phosphatase [Candidatus Peregrinibacteria bacterium]|nr:SpoIIE family protein phosphatase [Candidatus Peregrinibacteria bacterium]
MYSLKTKLVVIVSTLVLFIVFITAFLLIKEKEKELMQDIYLRSLSFAELTGKDIVQNYELYVLEGGSLYFQREMADVFSKNEDVFSIRLLSFSGDVLYDSSDSDDHQYGVQVPNIQDASLLNRVQAQYPSLFTQKTRRILYLKKDTDFNFLTVDNFDQPIAPISDFERIANIVYPVNHRYALIYDISYENLENRIVHMRERIILLALFGIMISFIAAYLFSSRITKHIDLLVTGVRSIAKGDFKQRVNVKSHDEVSFLADAFNKMAKDLESSVKAKIYKERVAKELEMAAKIQKELLPKRIPDIPGLDIAAGLIPALEIGGDCFDFIRASKNDTLMYIGDVTGHGVPSGIIVAIANAVLYSLVNIDDMKEILIRTNQILQAKAGPNMFLTMLMLRWNSLQKSLFYISAGHEKMIHIDSKDKTLSLLEGGGMALGMLANIAPLLKERKVDFRPGDMLVLYSDGITEARSRGGKIYGLERLKDVLKINIHLQSAEAMKNVILSDVKDFTHGGKQSDDITILVIARKK